MKFIIVLSVLIIAVHGLSEEFKKKLMVTVESLGKECLQTIPASEDELKAIMNHEQVSTYDGKCLLSCLFKKYHMQTEDGKFDLESTKKLLEMVKPDDMEAYNKYIQLVETCFAEVPDEPDQCEGAAKMTLCMENMKKKLGGLL